MNIREAIRAVTERHDLTIEEACSSALEIMEGHATDAQIAALLIGLNMKGIQPSEITGFALAMRDKATKIEIPRTDLIDTCGTGGDMSGTFNISTVSAFVAAGAGCCVMKHGNRSVSSGCGSADLLEKLGVKLDALPEKLKACAENAGIAFLFAPSLHKAMKYAVGPRKEIGVRTIFNVLGPLTNPAGARRQLIGVFNRDLTLVVGEVLKNLGSAHCLIVHGTDGLDEITLTGNTAVCELKNGGIREFLINPLEFGFELSGRDELKGGDSTRNAEITLEILSGRPGPARDIVLLNAGAAIYVSGKVPDIARGVEAARVSIDSGRAAFALKKLRELSN
ncbi:MAG: anthranilate phosphoribosyltransferase [Candidatus Wallbacteria bacterium]|nr:anthranilate phosphoribosyltransferase [Candidatus Wallbacteria bacterium]